MLIDRFLPKYDVTSVCETSVDAPPQETYVAIRETNLKDPIIDFLFALRELPLRIARRLRGEPSPPGSPKEVTFADITTQGPSWVSLAEEPGVEFVVGSVGRFWRKDYGGRKVTPEEFERFAEPGYAKLAISLAVRPAGAGTILRYEARTATTDEAARRTFRRYWRVIGLGVALIMRRAVRAIKAEAERRMGRPAPATAGRPRVLSSVRATHLERHQPLPGDRLIQEPIASLTHAITVECDRRALWPWLAQMGAGRAGWYSYDFIDNGRRPSAMEVLPELQTIGVGTLFPALPGAKDGFIVAECEPERSLVLGWPSPEGIYLSTWAFVLDDAGPGRTRLMVRARGNRAYQFHGLPLWLIKRIVPAGHYVMQRKQLHEIARRVQQRTHSPVEARA